MQLFITLLLIAASSSIIGIQYYIKPKVIVIGLDGASWNFIDRLVSAHQLPYFEKLLKNSAYGNLKSFRPTKSSVLWTSIATGKCKEKHGIVDWQDVDAQTKERIQRIRLITGNDRTAAAIWEILSKKKYTVGVDNWWVTYPAVQVNGFLITDRLRAAIIQKKIADEKDLVYPPELINELKPMILKPIEIAPVIHKYKFVGYAPGKIDTFYSPSNFFKDLYSKIELYVGMDQMAAEWSLHMLRKKQPDFFAIVLRITDVYAHLAWRFIEKAKLERIVPQIPLENMYSPDKQVRDKAFSLINELDGEYAKALLPAYKFADDYIGKILSLMDSNTILIIVSDHGFSWNGGGYDHNSLAGRSQPKEPPLGIILVSGNDIKPARIENANLYDVTPTILYALGEPVGQDMDGHAIKYVYKDFLLRKRKEAFIASYGVGPVNKNAVPSHAADKAVEEDLRSLGYIK